MGPQTTKRHSAGIRPRLKNATWCRMFSLASHRSIYRSPLWGRSLQCPFIVRRLHCSVCFIIKANARSQARSKQFGTMFGVSSLGTVSLEELSSNFSFPQVYQFYFHKDRGLNIAMLERAKSAGVQIMMLTVEFDHWRQS